MSTRSFPEEELQTNTLQVYFLEPSFAVMVAVPLPTAVTFPLRSTVATAFLLEDHFGFLDVPDSFKVLD